MVAPLGHALTPCQATADSGQQLARREWFDKISLPLPRHCQHPHRRSWNMWPIPYPRDSLEVALDAV